MVYKEKVKENAKQATKWTLSKLWRGTVASARYLWSGTKMVAEDLNRKIAKKKPKKRSLKARFKQAVAVTAAAGALVFGGEKTVQHYQNKEVNQRTAEFLNSVDYLFKKHGYPINPKSAVWSISNQGVSKLSQQELRDRQLFLNYVEGYLKKFAYLRTSLDFEKLSEPLSVQTQRDLMEDSIGSDLVEKGRLAQQDPSQLKDYQICSRACDIAIAIVAKAQKQKSEYACFDCVKTELDKLKLLKEATAGYRASSKDLTAVDLLKQKDR